MWFLYAIAACVIWGLSYALDEKAFQSNITPLTLLACQTGLGFAVFLPLAYYSNLKAELMNGLYQPKILLILLAAVICANLGNFFIALSINAKNAVLAAIIEEAYPLFTILFSYFLFRKTHLTLPVVIGGILIITGIMIISIFEMK